MKDYLNMVNKINQKKAHLLIGNYEHTSDLKRLILDSSFSAFDYNIPTCRFRGSFIDTQESIRHIKLLGWQRNISRLRKMDVSLPTIIRITLNEDEAIEDIQLDNSYKGSKGLICNWKYLNENLSLKLKGEIFNSKFIHKVKVKNTHCFHLYEVLSALFSYYQLLKSDGFKEIYPAGYAFEEEVIDSYIKDKTLVSSGTLLLKSREPIQYQLRLNNILDSVCFDKNGTLKMEGGIEASFYLNDKLRLLETVSINNPSSKCKDLSKYLFACIKYLKINLFLDKSIRMYNTNLYPGAYIGMLIQSLAIRLFNNNYNYIMHALTSLQRPGNIPLCIGALRDQEEGNKYFHRFSFSDLI